MSSDEPNKKSADKAPDGSKDKPEKQSSEERKKSNALQICLEGIRQLSDMLQEFTDLVPAAGLNPALQTLSTIIAAIQARAAVGNAARRTLTGILPQDAQDNKETLKDDLLPRIERIRDRIVMPLIDKGDAAEPVAKSVGSRLAAALDKIGEKVEGMNRQGRVVRFIYHKVNKDDIQKFGKQLDGILSEFTLHKIDQLVATGQEQLEVVKDTRKIMLDKAQRELISGLPHVDAFYKSKNRAGKNACDLNTRLTVLDGIKKWAESPNVDVPQVFWLRGLAGIGKSTICHTIAKWLAEESTAKLGANYFFSRDKTDLADAYSFFPTLAYQLSQCSPEFGQALAKALEKDPFAPGSVLESQCETLLSKPLSSTESEGLPPLVIVVDALDECSQGVHTSAKLLAPLIDAIRSSKTPVRLLVSSRPGPEIADFFDSLELQSAYTVLTLHEVDVQNDIRAYMQSRFDEMCRLKPKLSRNWITGKEIDQLVAYALPLFAVVAVIVNFASKPRKDPRQQVKILLDQSSSAKHSPYSHMDTLYLQVLAYAYSEDDDDDDDDRNRLKLLLSTIVMLRVPMSLSALTAFLSIDDEDAVFICLQTVASVLLIPDLESVDGTVRIFHSSFRDFLTDASRCTNPFYHIRKDETHSDLALRCLHTLNTELRRDICGLGSAPYTNADFPDLEERLAECLPQHVRYSCLYFSDHIMSTKDDEGRVASALETFCLEKLLMWIEVLGLTQQVDVLLSILESLNNWYLNLANSNIRVGNILSDAFRFVSRFRELIEASTGDIYGSLLAIMPICEMKATYLALPSARLIGGLPVMSEDWSSYHWRAELSFHPNNTLDQLVFSPNGKFLAATTWSTHMCRCKVWNAHSGATMNELTAPSGGGGSFAAFSAESTSLAYASFAEMKVSIYDLATCSVSRVLTVDTDGIESRIVLVTYVKGDDESLVVVTSSGHINVWSTNAGGEDSSCRNFTLASGTYQIYWASVSEDGTMLATVSVDDTLDTWDILTGCRIREAILQLPPLHDMYGLLFLVGGTHLAVYYRSAVVKTTMKTLKVLDIDTGNCLQSIDEAEDTYWSMTSMAGIRGRLTLLFGSSGLSFDSQIHMYYEDCASYVALAIPKNLHRARSPVNQPSRIAFSADGLLLADGSNHVVSVHDVHTLKPVGSNSELSWNGPEPYLSHGLNGTLYDVLRDPQTDPPDILVHINCPQSSCDTSHRILLQESLMGDTPVYRLQGYYWIEQNSHSFVMTDLRTRKPCFGFSTKDRNHWIAHVAFGVSFDGGRRVIITSGHWYGSDEVWVYDLDNGAFVTIPWAPGLYDGTDIHLALDGRSFLTVAYNCEQVVDKDGWSDHTDKDKNRMTSWAVWEMYPSNPPQVPKKFLEGFGEKRGVRVREVISLAGGGINRKPKDVYTGNRDYIWAVIDPGYLSSKSYKVGGEVFLHTVPGESSPRFLIVRRSRLELQVGEVKRRLCWIPPEWSPKNWIEDVSSWSGSELAFRTKNDKLIRINTDELEECLYGSKLG